VSLADRLRAPRTADCVAAIAEIRARGTAGLAEVHGLVDCLGDERKVIVRRAADACAALHVRGVGVAAALADALRSAQPRRRWGAAYALSLIGLHTRESLPVVLEALGAADGDVRWAAADILVHLQGLADLLPALHDILRTGSPAQRKMAAYCLRDRDVRTPDILRALTAALADPDPSVRIAAMSALTRLATDRPAVADAVVARLADDDAGVRRAAAALLGAIAAPSAPVLDALRAATHSDDASLRRAATRSLRLLGSHGSLE